MTTLDDVAKKVAGQSAEQKAAVELVRLAREQGLSLTGPDGLLKQLTKTVLETAFERGDDRAPRLRETRPARGGYGQYSQRRSKDRAAETTGPVELDVPRDRASTFWMSVLTDLRNRGVEDTFVVVCDGVGAALAWDTKASGS